MGELRQQSAIYEDGIMTSRFPAALAIVLLCAAAMLPSEAASQSVLKVARGLQSNNISVFVNRAVVLESNQRFTEVSVAQPEIADVSPLSDRSIYIFGRTRGTTTLTLLGENGTLITNVTIQVQPDLNELKERLRALLPREPIEVRGAGGSIVLSGVVSGKAKIDRAIALARAYGGDAVTNMMSVGGTQQVMLKVKIAEMSRNSGKALGVSTALFRNAGNSVRPFTQTGQSIGNNLDGGDTVFENLLGAASPLSAFGTFGALFSFADGFLLDLQIDALEEKGFARTLAEPNLVALSGTEATFLAGGEVPIPTVEEDGEIEITFKPVGVALNFRPSVLDDDLINIALSAEVSEIDATLGINTGGIEIPGFIVRRANSTVELRDGQSFAIAGLLNETFADTIAQVPWIGDVPILGTLFRSTDYQRNQSELVIIVTAHLVTPVDDGDSLSLPTDRVRIPNERELFLLGRTTAPAVFDGASGQGFDGAFGYVVE